MAQTIDIKVLIDAAESVKTIKEARQALKDLRSAALQVEEGSPAFIEVQRAAGGLQDRIGDLQNTTKFFANDLRRLEGFTSIAQGIAGGFALAQGAAMLFGGENEKLNESLVKLNSVMSILNGLQAVGTVLQKDSAASLLVSNGIRNIAIGLTTAETRATAAKAVADGVATTSQRALNAAMSANPIGALITLIVAATAAFLAFGKSSDKAKKEEEARKKAIEEANAAQEKQNTYIADNTKSLTSLLMELSATNAGSAERLALMKSINDTYGLTLQNLSDENAFQAQLNTTVNEYIELQYQKYLLAENEEKISKLNAKRLEGEKLLAEVQRQYNKEKLKAGTVITYFDNAINANTMKTLKADETLKDFLFRFGDYEQKQIKGNKLVNEATEAQLELGKANGNLRQEINKITEEGKKYEVQTKKTTTTTKDNTKSTDENAKAVEALADAYKDLSELTAEFEQERLSAYLERVKSTLTDELSIRQNEFRVELQELQNQKNEELQAVIEAEVEKLKIEKDFKKQKKEDEADYTKRLEEEALKRLKNSKEYIDVEAAYTALVEEKKRLFIQTTNEFIAEQQQALLESTKKVAEEILSPAQFTIFFQAAQRVLNQNQNIISAQEVSLENFNDTLLDLNKAILLNSGDIGKKLLINLTKSSKEQNSALLDIIQNGGQEITQTLNDLQQDSYVKQTKIITDLLNLSTEYQKANIDDTQLFILKIGAFYQDKFNLIKQVEEEVKKASGIEKSFFGATEEQIQKEVLLLKERKAIKAEDFKTTEEYEGALRRLALERLNFTIEDNEKLSEALQKRFDTLIKAEENNYAQSLSNLLESNRTKKITDEQYLKGLEDLQKSHNDNILNIEVAYGQKSFEEVANRRKAIIEEQKAENKEKEDLLKEAADKEIELRKKVVAEYLSVEQELQSALFELFQRTQQERERTAQATYDNEIARIEAAEKKYEDSLANRTAAEQADLDVKAGFAEQRQNAEKRLNDEKNRIAQKAFTAQKVNDLSTITIQTAVAIAKTIAELGGVGAITPPGIALIAAVAAQGAIQASLVASQQFVPQYATGGLVSGPGTGTSDSVLVRVSNGESIINARSTKKYQPILSAINVDGGGKSFAPGFANGGMVDMTTYSSRDNMMEIKELLLQINSRPIETYVKQTVVENASQKSDRLKRRTTFG